MFEKLSGMDRAGNTRLGTSLQACDFAASHSCHLEPEHSTGHLNPSVEGHCVSTKRGPLCEAPVHSMSSGAPNSREVCQGD